MKLLIALIVSLSAFTAQAESVVSIIASYEFGLSSDENQSEVVTANLHKDGSLVVSAQSFALNGQPIELPKFQAEKKLHPENFNRLLGYAGTLANSEIETVLLFAVCELYAAPHMFYDDLHVARDYNYQDKTFNGALELVQGPQGCWIGKKVYPRDSHSRQIGVRLKETLRTLALELMN